MTLDQARAFWLERQGLARPSHESLADVVARSGWLPTPGGASPYLALRARVAGFRRADLERAAYDTGALVDVLGLGGASMLVPAADAGLALRAAAAATAERRARLRERADLGARELGRLVEAVVAALEAGPATATDLAARVPARLQRSLGEAGRRASHPTSLSFAIREAQLGGLVQRHMAGRRFDFDKLEFVLWRKNPLDASPAPADLDAELARRFLRWAGPATLDELARTTGVAGREAGRAATAAGAVPVTVTNFAAKAFVLPEDLEALLAAVEQPTTTPIALVPAGDAYLAHRSTLAPLVATGGERAMVLDASDAERPIAEATSLHHHAVLEAGRVVGLWDQDPDTDRMLWRPIAPPSATAAREIARAVDVLGDFVHEQLGEVKLAASESAASRRARAALVRALR